jgi:immune inhibitor A
MDGSCSITCIVLLIILLILCCLCLAGVVGLLFLLPDYEIILDPWLESNSPQNTPVVLRPTPIYTPMMSPGVQVTPNMDNGIPSPGVTPIPPEYSTETLETLRNAIIPTRDLRDLAFRLDGKLNIPLTLPPPSAPLTIGTEKTFWAVNMDSNQAFQVTARLRYITEHVYFFIEDGVRYDDQALADLVETFEHEIYPTTRNFFGSEWKPGVDGDPRLYILYVRSIGSSVAGYFSSADSYHPMAHEYSNGHEMFFISADNTNLRDDYLYGVLAHEFQHMIHWYQDRNEESWLDEGFAELASFINGYHFGGFASQYARNTDIQLNDWPEGARSAHYGASFLFVTYFLDRFGENVTKALVAEQENGMDSIDIVLYQMGITDPLTGEDISADSFFMDWVVTNYLLDGDVADGRYTYNIFPEAPQARDTETVRNCPTETLTRDVRQYGADYIQIKCKGDFILSFEGSTIAPVVPAEAFSGDYFFWSNMGDESNMRLTRQFDFTDHTGPLTFSYWTWYDIEHDYDYVYLLASEDGDRWEILFPPSGTPENPSGNSYGWAYNGYSGMGPIWIQEEVDLSHFAGKSVFLRFEYITDASVHGAGFLLDDVEIPEIGYFADFEDGQDDWEAEGFVLIQNVLPQTYRLALIYKGHRTFVEHFVLDFDSRADIPLHLGGDVNEVVLVVSGTTRYTREPAAYRFSIEP